VLAVAAAIVQLVDALAAERPARGSPDDLLTFPLTRAPLSAGQVALNNITVQLPTVVPNPST